MTPPKARTATQGAWSVPDAYQRGAVLPARFRGRAGQAHAVQVAEYARLASAGSLPVAALT